MFDELIVRLEQATGPDRQLDVAIAEAIGDERLVPFHAYRGSDEWIGDKFIWRYTASLDAALTLWDEPGKHWTKGVNLFYAIMPGRKMQWGSLAWESNGQYILDRGRGEHKHRAIATCIAALKARTSAQVSQALAASESEASPQ